MIVDRFGKGGLHHYSMGLASALDAEGATVTLLTTTPREELPWQPGDVHVQQRLLWGESDTRLTALLREVANIIITLWFVLRSHSRVVVIQVAYTTITDRWTVPILQALGRSVVLTCHNLGWHERGGHIGSRGIVTYRRADHVVTLSDYELRRLRSAVPEVEARSRAIPHGDLGFLVGERSRRSEARRRLGLVQDGPLLLFFGYIKEYKGVDVLVDAIAVLRDRGRPISLVCAGQADPRVADDVDARIRRLELDDLVEVRRGYVPTGAAADYFAASDAVVMPYRHATQSGVVQFAYAHARPVVVTEVGGLAEDVVAGITGEVAPPENPEALADAIERLVGDPAKLSAVEGHLQEGPPERNRWNRVAGDYLDLMGEVGEDDRPVVVWVTDVHWEGVWYGAQHLASRLAHRGYRVLFCEVPASVLSPVRDPSRLRQLGRRLRRLGPGLAVDAPLGVPPQDDVRLRGLNSRLYARRIRRTLVRLGWGMPALIVGRYQYSWRLAEHFPDAVFVANLSDTTWSTDEADAAETAEMSARLEAADAAVCVSAPLIRRAEKSGVARTLLLPQGVDAERVRSAAERGPDPTVSAVGGPVIGCLGAITPRIDFALIDTLAAARPNWQFVFVGPAGVLFRELGTGFDAVSVELDERPNVHRLPPCAPADVGSVIAAFDVAWIPYVWSEFNEASNPLKAWEYLAAGAPLVAPAFPALEPMGAVATLLGRDATDADWLDAFEAALGDDDPERAEARRGFAAANTWDQRADTLAGFFATLI